MKYSVLEITTLTGTEYVGNPHQIIRRIAFDSRTIFTADQTAFLAINTTKNSGEKYILSAVDKGVKVIIAEHIIQNIPDVTWILVNNSAEFLQQLAQKHLERFPNLQTIGITGSNGKTMVKEWLYQSFSEKYNTVKSPKSFNSQIGLPISLLQISDKNEVGIFEVGISKPTEMEKLEQIFSPKTGILTHIGSAHAANFTDETELITEKLKLFKHAKDIIFPGDNEQIFKQIADKYSEKKLISFGFEKSNSVHIASDWKNRMVDVTVNVFGENIEIPVQQRDEATLSNMLCVVACLHLFNFSTQEIVENINRLKSVEMRLESVEGVRNNLIINDSYNLDMDSLSIAYQFIKEYNRSSKNLVITDFIEGRNSSELYHEVAEITNQQHFDKIFLIGTEITQYEKYFKGETYVFNTTSQFIESQEINRIENALVLLKGARKFEIEKIKNILELQKHDTVLEINLNAILHNINVHRALLKPETKIMAMVKAFSYGLGGYEIAEFLQHHHIDYLAVAYADEGMNLRKNGITTPIMVMNPEQHSYGSIIDFSLEPEIYSFRVLELFSEQLKTKGWENKYPVHIKIETGMHRLGFKEDDIENLAEKLSKLPVTVRSVFSHLSTADEPLEKEYALEQLNTFQRVSGKFAELLGYQPLQHILNSPGISYLSDYQFDMVRIGIGMVGISANPEIQRKLQSAVTFKTVISQISEINEGDSVGYSRKFKAAKNTKIATIPVGYADGIPRLIGNGIGSVGIKNHLAPIIGNICMDMMMIEIGNLPVNEGDEVIIFNSHPTLQEFANYCKTIPYEVLTSISRRVKRIYIKN